MSISRNPKYSYLAFIAAADSDSLAEVVKTAHSKFSVVGLDLAVRSITDDLMVVAVSSESPIESQLISIFEARIDGMKYADILLSYQSSQPVHLFALFIGYEFNEKVYPISANSYRRQLAMTAYNLTSAYVGHFYQSPTSTSMVICSEEAIPNEDIESLMELTRIRQVRTTISFEI